MDKFYNVTELAELLQLSKKYVRDLINEGGITAYKVGREWRISETALQEYLNQNINRKEEK